MQQTLSLSQSRILSPEQRRSSNASACAHDNHIDHDGKAHKHEDYNPDAKVKKSDEVHVSQPEQSRLLHDINNFGQIECPICIDSFERKEKLHVLHCGHRFHSVCINDWLKTGSNHCPMCRHAVGGVEYLVEVLF